MCVKCKIVVVHDILNPELPDSIGSWQVWEPICLTPMQHEYYTDMNDVTVIKIVYLRLILR
jgi:hypothetical protein